MFIIFICSLYTHFLFSKELVWENIADVMPTEAKEENGAFSVPLLAKSVSQTIQIISLVKIIKIVLLSYSWAWKSNFPALLGNDERPNIQRTTDGHEGSLDNTFKNLFIIFVVNFSVFSIFVTYFWNCNFPMNPHVR